MLQPNNRLTLIDAMRPPAGYEIDHAMAVTYTLDLRALLAAPAAFALAATETTGRTAGDEPIELLHAVRRYADRITVFSQVGAIALPPSRKVYSFVEGSVVPVTAPRGGIVHPKVWVIRYSRIEPAGHAPHLVHRALIASRNLTFDESWDTMVRLDETDAEGAQTDDTSGSAIAELFEGLATCAARPLRDDEATRIRELSTGLRRARFALPGGVDSVRVHAIGFGTPISPFPEHADRALVISPFLDNGFFARITPAPVDELVSRHDQIATLGPGTRATIGRLLTLDDGSAPDTSIDRRSIDDPGRPITGLHAKVFAFEHGDRAHLFLGSANATTAAFERNVEVLIEFEGTTDRLGIDALTDGNADEPGFKQLLVDYVERDADDEQPDTTLDDARREIAELDVFGTVEPSGDGWAVTYRTTEPIPADNGVTVSCWPLTTEGNRRAVSLGEPLLVRFETTLESISGFLAFELELDGERTGFVVPVPLDGVPDERDRALMKSLVGNAERFFRYLLALLDDTPGFGADTRANVERLTTDDTSDPVTGLPVLERLLRTLRREPEKLIALQPLVHDLAGDGVLPSGFLDLWSTLLDAGLIGDTR